MFKGNKITPPDITLTESTVMGVIADVKSNDWKDRAACYTQRHELVFMPTLDVPDETLLYATNLSESKIVSFDSKMETNRSALKLVNDALTRINLERKKLRIESRAKHIAKTAAENAVKTCVICPVAKQCAASALGEEAQQCYGIYGGRMLSSSPKVRKDFIDELSGGDESVKKVLLKYQESQKQERHQQEISLDDSARKANILPQVELAF